jgi:hypothetical protein
MEPFFGTPNMRPSAHGCPSDTELKSSGKLFTVADDGHSYKEIASVYSSDPIDEYPPEKTHEKRRGLVLERVHQFENNTSYHEVGIPRVDFRQVNLKSGMKNKKVCRSTICILPIQISRRET